MTNAGKDNIYYEARLNGPLKADDPDVLQYLITHHVDDPSTGPYHLSTHAFYKNSKNSFSWKFIYNLVKTVFRGKREGFFVEAGALDGEFLSNTLWMEKELNWTGLLVEPNPYSYKELLKKNRKAWKSNTCLSVEPYPKETILVSIAGTKDKMFQRKWFYIGASYELGFAFKEDGDYKNFFAMTTPTYLNVQCFPLVSYLLALNRTTVDFISLDIQNSEWQVLKTFPFEKVKVTLFVVEHSDMEDIDLKFKDFFAKKGYVLIGCRGEPDYVFLRKDAFEKSDFKEVKKCYRG